MSVPSCIASKNLLCKHVLATKIFGVDLDNQIPPGVTITDVSAFSVDPLLTVDSVNVVTEITVIPGEDDCEDEVLMPLRSVIIVLSGGTSSYEETTVTLQWDQSDGRSDARELRLLVSGASPPA